MLVELGMLEHENRAALELVPVTLGVATGAGHKAEEIRPD